MKRLEINENNFDGLQGETFEALLNDFFNGSKTVALQGKTDLMIGGRRCECKTGSGKFKTFDVNGLDEIFAQGYRILSVHYIVYSYRGNPESAIICKTADFFKVAYENKMLRLRKDKYLGLRDMNYFQKKMGLYLGETFESLLLNNGGWLLSDFIKNI
jgi:hypothetical protein